MLKYSNRKCLVVRKVQATLRETIFALFKEQLSTMNLLQHCSVTSTNMKIILPNGSEFIFMGLDDPEKIKSITGIDDILIEEATDLNKEDFTQLNLRLRSKAPNQQIHMMFNPVSKENWIYGYFFKDGTPEDTTIVHTNYKDNPHLPEGYIKTLLSYKDKSEIDYQVYALGEWGVRGKRVFNNWKVGKFDYREIIRTNPNIEVRFSLDFGYVADPSAFIALLIDRKEKKIWIFDEMYLKGLTNDKIYEQILEMGYSKELIYADSAEQKSIEELKQLGLSKIRAVKKGNGSIMQGIQYLNQFDIIVHPDCIHTKSEMESYVYKLDKATGEYLNQPLDANNHLMDCLRYAVRDFSTKKPKFFSKSAFGL